LVPPHELMTWLLIIIGVVLLVGFVMGGEGEASDYSDEELMDELRNRHE